MNVRPLVCLNGSTRNYHYLNHTKGMSVINHAQELFLKIPALCCCLKAVHWGGEQAVIYNDDFFFFHQDDRVKSILCDIEIKTCAKGLMSKSRQLEERGLVWGTCV